MTQWTAFVAVTGVVLVSILVLSFLTQRAFESGDSSSGPPHHGGRRRGDRPRARTDGRTHGEASDSVLQDQAGASAASVVGPRESGADVGPVESPAEPAGTRRPERTAHEHRPGSGPVSERDQDHAHDVEGGPVKSDPRDLSTAALLANVAISQGLFAAILIGAALWTAIPLEALGIDVSLGYLLTGVFYGVGAGVLLYAGNELGAGLATRLGVDHDEELRELLAPDGAGGWAVLLGVVLPVIAVFEELLFRAALIGVVATGFDVNVWVLAVFSSVVFAVGHGIQGTAGIVVTGVLGFALAALFIFTGSLLVVVVAHYVINALEFVVHEALGFEWARPTPDRTTES